MSDRFVRGAVVARARRFGVVWQDDAAGLVILPLLRARPAMRHDVPLSLGELVECGAAVPDAAIRPRCSAPITRVSQVQVGTVPPDLMCRVVQAMVRVHVEASAEARWSGDRVHRERARQNCMQERG